MHDKHRMLLSYFRVVYTVKRVSIRSMSALGQKQTSDCRPLMSALPPKADMVQDDRDVRFVPQADSCTAAK